MDLGVDGLAFWPGFLAVFIQSYVFLIFLPTIGCGFVAARLGVALGADGCCRYSHDSPVVLVEHSLGLFV
jgi:hypothetical protein